MIDARFRDPPSISCRLLDRALSSTDDLGAEEQGGRGAKRPPARENLPPTGLEAGLEGAGLGTVFTAEHTETAEALAGLLQAMPVFAKATPRQTGLAQEWRLRSDNRVVRR